MSSQLSLTTTSHGHTAVVSVGGEIDLGTAGELADHVVSALEQAGPDLVLDLGGVTFMDSTGLKVLLAAHRRVQLKGGHLALAGVGRAVRKVLTVTGLDQTFVLTDTVEQALEAVAAAGPPQQAACD